MSIQILPGWYQDPEGLPQERYWNGSVWTDQSRPVSTPQYKHPHTPKSSGLDGNEVALFALLGLILFILFLWEM